MRCVGRDGPRSLLPVLVVAATLLSGCVDSSPPEPPAARQLVLTIADMPETWTLIREAPLEGAELRPAGCDSPKSGYYYVQEPQRNGGSDRYNVYTGARVFDSAGQAHSCYQSAVEAVRLQTTNTNLTSESTNYGDEGLQWKNASGPTLMLLREDHVVWNVQVTRYGNPTVTPSMDWIVHRLLEKLR